MRCLVPFKAAMPVVLAALAGCATQPGPNSVGNGRYLQLLQGSQVVYETDVVAAGHLNCPSQVGYILQQHPGWLARCAHEATTQPLPYSYRAHYQTNTGDEVRPSSPFLVRLATSQACAASVAATRTQPKAVILEDNCGR